MAIYSDISEIVKRLDLLYYENVSTDSDKGKFCHECKRFLPFEKFPTRSKFIRNNKGYSKKEYNNPTCQDCIDEKMAIKGLTMITKNFLEDELRENKRYVKIKKIIEKTECENCKYANSEIIINHYRGGKYETKEWRPKDDNNPACKYCSDRFEMLNDIKYKMQEEVDKIVINTIENRQDIIKLRIILNKISKKLKSYDAS